MKILIFESETPDVIASLERSQAEHYGAQLQAIDPAIDFGIAEPYARSWSADELDGFDAAVFPGASVAWSVDANEAAPLRAAMEAVFARALPCFGSCNGFQLAALLLGGRVENREPEIGIAREIELTAAGRAHPMMAGRGPVFAAPTIHGDQVVELPSRAEHLAGNAHCAIQAFACRDGNVDFWGVEYHPEYSIAEIGRYLRQRAGDFPNHQHLVDDMLVAENDAEAAARLGSNPREMSPPQRNTELRNWITHLETPPNRGTQYPFT